MPHYTRLGSSTALCALLAAGPAFADVTARQVWDDMRGYVEGMGSAIEATESTSGDTLELADIAISVPIPDVGGAVSVTVDALSMTDNGDGTVSIVYPAENRIRVEARPDEGEQVDMTLLLTQTGLEITASGTPEQMTYDYEAQSVGLSLERFERDGVPMPPEAMAIAMAMRDMTGQSVMSGDTVRNIAQVMTIAEITYDLNVAPPEESGRMALKGGMQGVSLDGTLAMPKGYDMTEMGAALRAGYAVDSTVSYTGGNADFNFEENGEVTAGTSSSDGGSLVTELNADRMRYAATGENTRMNIRGTALPVPVAFELGRTAFNLLTPVTASDEARPFELGLTLGDFTMDDQLWSIFDPQGALPRDPATVSLDLSGALRLLVNIFEPLAMETMGSGDEVPMQPVDVSLNDLTVRAVGAELTGTGAATFDASDMTTFPGMPRPEGQIDLRLTGGNALIEKLVAMGLLPEEQAMGARMMLGMFAVPAGEDTLTSTIEINNQGHVIANGQRLQ